MARHFTPRDMLRRVPGAILRELFERHAPAGTELGSDDDFDSPGWAYEFLAKLEPVVQHGVTRALRQAHDLGTKPGLAMLTAEAQFQGLEPLDADIEQWGLATAALVFALRHPAVFQKIDLVRRSEQLYQRYWQVLAGLQGATLDSSPGTADEFGRWLGDRLFEAEGRGRRCTVEYLAHLGREHYFFCYPDDFTATEVAHDDGGQLRRREVLRTFEVIFCYEPAKCSLHVYAPVPRATRVLFVERFCRSVLGCEAPPENAKRPAYRLDELRLRDFALPFDPVDGVTSVRPVKLRFSENLSGGTRITLELPKDDTRPVAGAVALYLSEERFPLRQWHLTQVALEVRYRAPDEERERRFQFEVTHPHSCSLKNKTDFERSLGERLLAKWGLSDA